MDHWQPLYRYSRLDHIENLENYRPGGFHPVSIGDVLASGRYRILHKLGSGGSSTVWLARCQQRQRLVTLKVLSAEHSPKPRVEIAALHVPRLLQKQLAATANTALAHVQVIEDDFLEVGPNGSHVCLVSPLAGLSIDAMSYSPGRASGSRRLRADLARKVARQSAIVLEAMHSARFVHGDITSSNILFKVSEKVYNWSDDEVYVHLGTPRTDAVYTREGSPPGLSAPPRVVAPVDITRLSSSSLLEEDIVFIDFGQSFAVDHKPADYSPAGPFHFIAPEAWFDAQMGPAADVWAFACVLFEIRAGAALFDPFFGSRDLIVKQTVEMLGRLPDAWWAAWDTDNRRLWFEESGSPRARDEQERDGVRFTAIASSLRERVENIGAQDVPPEAYEGPMVEMTGERLAQREVELFTDLLEKMLRYAPEERITMREVVRHPWFTCN